MAFGKAIRPLAYGMSDVSCTVGRLAGRLAGRTSFGQWFEVSAVDCRT